MINDSSLNGNGGKQIKVEDVDQEKQKKILSNRGILCVFFGFISQSPEKVTAPRL